MEDQTNDESLSLRDQFSGTEETLLRDTLEGIQYATEFKSVLVESMESTRQIMNSEASSLMLLDEDTGDLFISMPTGPAKKDVMGKRVPKSKGIGGWVIENRRPYLSNDVSSSGKFFGELSEEFTTRSMICVPLINRSNNVIGVLQAINRRNNEEFTPHHIPVFQALASHVTAAIERSRQIDKLHDRLKEKDTIIAEIHHRIKNNLQVLSEQVNSELSDIEDEHAKSVLKDMGSRISSMSRLHDMLCEKDLKNEVDLGRYLKQLVVKIDEVMSSIHLKVKIRVEADHIEISQERALLCGLILNELMLNIYKHAFIRDDADANIEIQLRSVDESDISLSVSDNGVGLPEDFSLRKSSSVGMWVVEEMLKKLDATIKEESEGGTRFSILFPKQRAE